MRLFFGSIASLLLVMLVIGCTWVDADECWVNTSGGFGGGGMIPIGAGVGATTSGDFLTPPPKEPLDESGKPNPCVAQPSMAGNVDYFRPGNFPFVTIVADDGTDKGAGWQEARATLILINDVDIMTRDIVSCQVRIGIPLRTAVFGKISASTAAEYSANVANAAAMKLWPTDLPPGIFCIRFKDQMTEIWNDLYKGLGASMMPL